VGRFVPELILRTVRGTDERVDVCFR
jgi:hypothetical protein